MADQFLILILSSARHLSKIKAQYTYALNKLVTKLRKAADYHSILGAFRIGSGCS